MKELVKFIGTLLIGCAIFFFGYFLGQKKVERKYTERNEGILEVISNYKSEEKSGLLDQIDSLNATIKELESQEKAIDTLIIVSRENLLSLPLDSSVLYLRDKLKTYDCLLENNRP